MTGRESHQKFTLKPDNCRKRDQTIKKKKKKVKVKKLNKKVK